VHWFFLRETLAMPRNMSQGKYFFNKQLAVRPAAGLGECVIASK
jgi:hypothetical protein